MQCSDIGRSITTLHKSKICLPTNNSSWVKHMSFYIHQFIVQTYSNIQNPLFCSSWKLKQTVSNENDVSYFLFICKVIYKTFRNICVLSQTKHWSPFSYTCFKDKTQHTSYWYILTIIYWEVYIKHNSLHHIHTYDMNLWTAIVIAHHNVCPSLWCSNVKRTMI